MIKNIYRDGIEGKINGNIKVRTTSDGHVVESWIDEKGKKVYFANLYDSTYCAHGETMAEAISAAIWKDPARRPNIEELKAEINSKIDTYKISLNEFRLITGACEYGCKEFLKKHNMKTSVKLTLKEFIPIGGEWAVILRRRLEE